MADEAPRFDELRRRMSNDPSSVAFAALAEQLRRAGRLEEAIRVCREGLEHHPTYVSAHVTLGRALMEAGAYTEAREPLAYVLDVAPDNLIASKCMAELDERLGPAPVGGPSTAMTDRSRAELEGWLARIVEERGRRAGHQAQ